MRISDWSSDVCSSDLSVAGRYADAGVTIERRDQWPAAELLGEADAVVVDQPEVRAATLDALARGSAVLLTIDDLGDRPAYPGDVVLNQNAHATPDLYRGKTDRKSVV